MIADPRRRILSGSIAGTCVVACTTMLNLWARRRGLLSRGMDLRELAPFVDEKRFPAGSLAAGIAVHVAAGVGDGGLYGLACRRFSVRSGVGFMAVLWLITMLVVMPMTKQGLFGMRSGVEVPAATLVLHVVFGMGLGALARLVYRAL